MKKAYLNIFIISLVASILWNSIPLYAQAGHTNAQNQTKKETSPTSPLTRTLLLLFGAGILASLWYYTIHSKEVVSDKPIQGPHIDSIKWGSIQVSNNKKIDTYRDCKIWPTGSREWNWKETGTQHNPGIQIIDVQELLDQVDIIILSRGMELVLQVMPETERYISSQGKELYILQSEEAVRRYNQLTAQGRRVGALIHSTC